MKKRWQTLLLMLLLTVLSAVTVLAAEQQEKRTDRAVIQYATAADGYVTAQFTGKTDKRLKAQVKGPGSTYSYNMTPGKVETFPLSDGNGNYQVTVYENTSGNKYAVVVSASFKVML
ncbi:MAG: hypothetical protein Q4C06_08370, partial [Bacillota bacterium]|nr:hypothetical protein [Bacillota bacterium]